MSEGRDISLTMGAIVTMLLALALWGQNFAPTPTPWVLDSAGYSVVAQWMGSPEIGGTTVTGAASGARTK